jgi:hypothetical protein
VAPIQAANEYAAEQYLPLGLGQLKHFYLLIKVE